MQTRTLSTALALVMTIAILGSAVAMWYDTLKIHATIGTGEVDVEFGGAWCVEAPEGEYGKPWVANCSVTLEDMEDEYDGPDDDDLDLIITISNAYPGYAATVCFEVKNVGSIPVKGPFGEELGTFPEEEELDLDGDGDTDVVVRYSLGVVQIDPGESWTFSITVGVLQNSPENSELELQLHLYFVQWNEAPA